MVEELFVIPSSFAQQRLWFLDQLEPGNAIYNIPGAFRLEGRLDTTVLVKSLNEIVRRHEVLRTAFAMVDGEPVQIITPSLELELPVIDLTQLETTERAARVGQLLSEERRLGFNLERAPLLRAQVLRLGAEEHVFSLTLHHIVADAWSIGVLVRELTEIYTCYQNGESSPLPELSIQYADYAVWQRQRLAGAALEAELEFWKGHLSGAPTLLDLPLDRERPAMGSFRGAMLPVEISSSLSTALRKLSQSEGVTPFMTLLGGFALLLQRYTGQEDILIGTPIAGRTQPETKDLIGFFVNTLVLRTNLSGNPTVREFLARVKEVCWDAYAHQEVPFERLVEELQPERSLSHSPLFQVMLAFNNTTQEEFQLSGLKLTQLEMETDTAKFDLSLNLDDGEMLTGVLRYNSDLFDSATISRMLGHWERLLEGLVANPEKKINELPLLGREEWEEIVVRWNATEVVERGRSVAEEFEKQVARTPDEVAVVHEGVAVSYRELNERANQLGHYLRRQGVGAETLVGVCLERSVELVVGMLGVLKAGGAYVPIDPQYPAERVKYLLADGGVKVVVTNAAVWERFVGSEGRVVYLDREREEVKRESGENPAVGSEGENLAYVIYTSGSTGTPKGVQLEQRGLLNLITWYQNNTGLNGRDRVAQVAGVTFDASLLEIWPTLLSGAALYFPPDETRVVPEELRDWLLTQSITISYVPTPVAEQLLQLEWPRETPLRALLTGGDRLHVYPSPPIPFVLVNNYGPTETTVVSSAGIIGSEKSAKLPSIGRPISNTKTYVLDAHLRVVPRGVQGELYIGGVGLARGYINGADLTGARFIPNPFSEKPGDRLYRTGDLVRWLAGGELEFIGRTDNQVKLRGYRIELGEIETALREHESVSDCVVVLREEQGQKSRLVAYVVSTAEMKPASSGDLRDHLRRKLPEYMIPAAFVPLKELPLTRHGKIDRRALPAPESLALEDSFVAPETETEKTLAALWMEMLGVPSVSRYDDFFEVGGHSLLATQMVWNIRETFRVDFSLRSFFEYSTIAEQGGLIETLRDQASDMRGPAIVPIGREQFRTSTPAGQVISRLEVSERHE